MLPVWPFFLPIFSVPAAAAQTATGAPTDTNFHPSLAVVIAMLSIMFSITFILLLYAKFCHRPSSIRTFTHQIQDSLIRSRSRSSGLEIAAVESLPFFRFSSLRGSRDGLDCAVCLSRFQDVEILRLLPNCNHAFHIHCIDQWLSKHSTCPLCRHKVTPQHFSDPKQEFNLDLYIQREPSYRNGSSTKDEDEETLPIPQNMDSEVAWQPLHRHNHRIVVSDAVLKYRWSNVSSSDLMFLNSEMLADASEARMSSKPAEIHDLNRNKCRNTAKEVNRNEQRSMSEIVVHPRMEESSGDVKEERRRRIWLPIARKTAQWFADRERVRKPAGYQDEPV